METFTPFENVIWCVVVILGALLAYAEIKYKF